MPKLSKQEIINLYKKPYSMGPMEIWKQGDYFNSIATIKKYIREAKASGEITEEDEEAFRKKEEVQEKEKRERYETLKSLVLPKILAAKPKTEIVREIQVEANIKTKTTEIGKLIEQLIQEGTLGQEEYQRIIKTIRENAAKKVHLTSQKRKETRSNETDKELEI